MKLLRSKTLEKQILYGILALPILFITSFLPVVQLHALEPENVVAGLEHGPIGGEVLHPVGTSDVGAPGEVGAKKLSSISTEPLFRPSSIGVAATPLSSVDRNFAEELKTVSIKAPALLDQNIKQLTPVIIKPYQDAITGLRNLFDKSTDPRMRAIYLAQIGQYGLLTDASARLYRADQYRNIIEAIQAINSPDFNPIGKALAENLNVIEEITNARRMQTQARSAIVALIPDKSVATILTEADKEYAIIMKQEEALAEQNKIQLFSFTNELSREFAKINQSLAKRIIDDITPQLQSWFDIEQTHWEQNERLALAMDYQSKIQSLLVDKTEMAAFKTSTSPVVKDIVNIEGMKAIIARLEKEQRGGFLGALIKVNDFTKGILGTGVSLMIFITGIVALLKGTQLRGGGGGGSSGSSGSSDSGQGQ